MFRGINGINIDGKGRMAMPSRYREHLQSSGCESLVVTIDTEERCLLLYPIHEWEEIERKLSALPSFNPAARRIQRLLIGHATELEWDNQGRLLLPTLLRDYAHLDKRAVLVGQGKKVELWDEATWNQKREFWLQAESGVDGSSIPEEVKSISL